MQGTQVESGKGLSHLVNSGCLTVGIEHLLVMLPSALLIAKYADTASGPLVTLPMILCSCGLATLLFTFLARPKAPFFLGPSISYIGFLSYQARLVETGSDIFHIRFMMFLGYLMAGAILICLSQLYRFRSVRKAMHTFFPYTVMGPAISLIGLQVVNTAVADSGLAGTDTTAIVLSLITLSCIIVVSLTGIRILRNASVLFGVLVGCGFAVLFGRLDWPPPSFQEVHFPAFQYLPTLSHLTGELSQLTPGEVLSLFFSVLLPSIVVFLELHGRILVFEGMLNRDGIPLTRYVPSGGIDELRQRVLTKHAWSHLLSVLVGITPCTIYAQNIAVMNLHNTDLSAKKGMQDGRKFVEACYDPFSLYPYRIAAMFCLAASLFTGLQNLIQLIPLPVFGGMELFLFGLIAAPGIQVLVEEQVNYKKISNQIITASVLIAGIGDFSLQVGSYELKGMSLGLFVGLTVNAVSLFLKRVGRLKEKMTLVEIFDLCMDSCENNMAEVRLNMGEETIGPEQRTPAEWKSYIHEKNMQAKLRRTKSIEIRTLGNTAPIQLWLHEDEYIMTVWLQETFWTQFANDHSGTCHIVRKQNGELDIELDEHVTDRILSKILANRV